MSPVLLLLSLGLVVDTATAAVPQPATALTPGATPIIPEVIVEAPEPRFVAPTRRDSIGRIWAPVLINGQGPFRLVLDTGANRSAIIAEVATRLGMPVGEAAAILVHGVTGSGMMPAIAVTGLQAGDLLMDATILPILPDVFGGAEGVLGTEGLADRRILIDFRHDLIVISRSHRQRAKSGFTTLPLKLTANRLLALDARVGSIRTRAIIDTGAQQTIGNPALRDALLRRAKRPEIEQGVIGVTLDVTPGNRMSIPPIFLGDIRIRDASVTIADPVIFQIWELTHQPALLIGMDIIGLLDTLIIDYKMRELQIRLPSR